MKVHPYDHLPLADQLSLIKLLIFLDGLECIKNFEKRSREILDEIMGEIKE